VPATRPQRSGWRVFENDSPAPELGSDGIGPLEIAGAPGPVPLGDEEFDLGRRDRGGTKLLLRLAG